MTIENLKQIAIKYATTKGSRVPLAPDELCNAVVQYFNEFLKITADINTIQVAVTEEGGNIVFTITGNTLDGKAFTPIVITVDHNDFVTNQEFEEFKTSVTKQLNNKRSVISSPASSYVVYTQANGLESNLPYSELANQTSTNIMARRANGTSDVKKGISGENVANMQNIADVEAKIPDVSNFATKDEIPDVSGFIKNENSNSAKGGFQIIGPTALRLIGIDNVNGYRNLIGSNENVLHIAASQRPDIDIAGTSTEEMAYLSDIPDTSSFITLAGNNIFTGENEFRNYTYNTANFCFVDTKEDYLTNGYTTTIKNGGFDIAYYENGEGKYWTTYADNQIINKDIDMESEVVIKFPKKAGTFALTSDVIKNPIYFISFYANAPSEPCHLIGTMMSKNSYGTGQKTNEEFAVMLTDNLYTNSNEGLAAYGKLAKKDILCIYSDDGLSIRCLDEENSEVVLPTVMFFVMETEL